MQTTATAPLLASRPRGAGPAAEPPAAAADGFALLLALLAAGPSPVAGPPAATVDGAGHEPATVPPALGATGAGDGRVAALAFPPGSGLAADAATVGLAAAAIAPANATAADAPILLADAPILLAEVPERGAAGPSPLLAAGDPPPPTIAFARAEPSGSRAALGLGASAGPVVPGRPAGTPAPAAPAAVLTERSPVPSDEGPAAALSLSAARTPASAAATGTVERRPALAIGAASGAAAAAATPDGDVPPVAARAASTTETAVALARGERPAAAADGPAPEPIALSGEAARETIALPGAVRASLADPGTGRDDPRGEAQASGSETSEPALAEIGPDTALPDAAAPARRVAPGEGTAPAALAHRAGAEAGASAVSAEPATASPTMPAASIDQPPVAPMAVEPRALVLGRQAELVAGYGAPAAPQPPAVQIAATILQRAEGPIERLQLRLEPAELGAIEITVASGERRRARAVLLVDRVETLELLQREQRSLERILVASGLELEPGGLELGLRREERGGERHGERPSPPPQPARADRAPEPVAAPRLASLRLLDLSI